MAPDLGKPDGQVFTEALLWISLFLFLALGSFKLSGLEYRVYRKTLRNYDSRNGPGSFPSSFF